MHSSHFPRYLSLISISGINGASESLMSDFRPFEDLGASEAQ
jgi:hypothetical protein